MPQQSKQPSEEPKKTSNRLQLHKEIAKKLGGKVVELVMENGKVIEKAVKTSLIILFIGFAVWNLFVINTEITQLAKLFNSELEELCQHLQK